MKIMHLVEAFGGGVFQSVRQLCEGMPEAEILLVHSIRGETPADYAKHFPAHVRLIHLPMQRAVNPKADFQAARALRQLVERERPAVVHAHSSKAGALARLALLKLPCKVFYSPRGYAFLMEDNSKLKRGIYFAIERVLGFLPGTTVACGYDEMEAAQLVSSRATCIPNALDADKVAPEHRTRPRFTGADPLRVVGCGRISPQKNFGAFCDVARALQAENISFTWVGGGELEGFDIPANIRITGWLDHAAAQQEMRQGQVLLHLSLWEGLSRVVLEAMAMGYPLVASPIAGNRELMARNNGFECPTAADAIQALQTLLKHPEKLATMGQASRQLLEERYNWPVNLAAWKRLYGF